jgi:Rieske Fe-S protein
MKKHMVREIDPRDTSSQENTALNPDVIRASDGKVVMQSERAIQEWREEFPYPWDQDEIMTRRDTLRFLLGTSGALFVATGILAIIGNVPAIPGAKAVPIARVGELGVDQWKVFNFPDQYAQGILINLPRKGLVAYSDVCTHLSCAVVYQGNNRLHCPCHEGLFDATTGNVVAGPPTRPLPIIQLAFSNGIVYAVKEVLR